MGSAHLPSSPPSHHTLVPMGLATLRTKPSLAISELYKLGESLDLSGLVLFFIVFILLFGFSGLLVGATGKSN